MRALPPLSRSLRPLSLAAGLLLGLHSPAAQIVAFVDAPETPADPSTLEWPAIVSLPKFDLSLGTLTGIRFTFTSTAQADVGFENQQAGASNTLDYSLPLTAEFLVPSEIVAHHQDFTLTGSSGLLGSYDGLTEYAGTSGITVSLTPSGASSTLDVAEADFSAYTHAGTPGSFDVSLYLDRGAEEVLGEGAKSFSYIDVVAVQARVTVTYSYLEGGDVPEAGGWVAAGGLGLVWMGWRWRCRARGGRSREAGVSRSAQV